MFNAWEQYVEAISTIWPTCFNSVAGWKKKNVHTYYVSGHTVQDSPTYCPHSMQHAVTRVWRHVMLVWHNVNLHLTIMLKASPTLCRIVWHYVRPLGHMHLFNLCCSGFSTHQLRQDPEAGICRGYGGVRDMEGQCTLASVMQEWSLGVCRPFHETHMPHLFGAMTRSIAVFVVVTLL
jgi:hypothetical protein